VQAARYVAHAASRTLRHVCRAGLLALLAGSACRAEDIALFKLTGIEGQVVVDYLRDELATEQTGAAIATGPSTQTQTSLREEIFVMTHSYVYHPNLLTLDIGGGPIQQDSGIELNGARTRSGETLYNFTGRATLLRDKPVRGSLFYDHLNPTVTVAPGEIMVQESSRYGFDFALSGPKVGFPLNLGYVRTQTQGEGSGRIVDDDLEQFSLNVNRSFGALGSTSLQYQAADQTSRSGSLSLPIQATTSTSRGLNVNTRLQFGATQQYDLTNSVSLNRREYTLSQGLLPDQGDFGFLLDLRTRPSKALSLFGTYHRNSSDQGDTSLLIQSLGGGFSYLPLPDLETGLSLRVERNDADAYALTSRVLDGSLRYKRALPLGSLQVSYGAKYDRRDQQASNPLVAVFDERIALAGTNQVALSHAHVTPGSVTVTNLTQTQTYIENVDYLVIVVGTETRVQRLAAGGILDGEEVLVDYSYDIGGTFASTQLDQTLSLNWNIARGIDTYLRWFDSAPEITSGVSTFPLNPVRGLLLGVRGEAPVRLGMWVSMGGSLEWEDRREEISPFRRESGDVFVQTSEPLFGLGNVRVTGRRSQVVYDFSEQDVDLTGFELRFWARHFGIDLIAVANYEQDLGGTTPRDRKDGSVNAVWRERRVTVTASLQYSHELQGEFVRDHAMFRLTGRRDF
jgi:hypothetical protein